MTPVVGINTVIFRNVQPFSYAVVVKVAKINSKLFKSSTLIVEQALICIDKLYFRLLELRFRWRVSTSFVKSSSLPTTPLGLVGVSLNEASTAKRKGAKPCGVSEIFAWPQDPIELINIGERNVLHAKFYGAIDARRQAIKESFDKEILKAWTNA